MEVLWSRAENNLRINSTNRFCSGHLRTADVEVVLNILGQEPSRGVIDEDV